MTVFFQTLPFFALMGCGYFAARIGFFGEQATAALTKFVFYFALSAMLFRFAAELDVAEVFDISAGLAYLLPLSIVYVLANLTAMIGGKGLGERAVEAQLATIGNNGFLAIPLLFLVLGENAIPMLLYILALDLLIFSSLIVIMIQAEKEGRITRDALFRVVLAVPKNPMIVSLALGLAFAWFHIPVPKPAQQFLVTLGAAATPCALFAIGASLAQRSAETWVTPLWLSFLKLILHPFLAAIFALYIFNLPAITSAVIIAASAMPTAGNIYIIAASYGVAPQRASATILISHVGAVVTLTMILAWVVDWV
ncbi:MAG: AEC family transporter [Pseudomonadota bacterium]